MAARVIPLRRIEAPEPVDIAAQWREDVRRRDWARVHIEGDRNPPISLWPRRWGYAGAGVRRQRGGGNG